MQALGDITIADFTQLMAGGWAAQKLGDMGADVIKIEPPGGEVQREMSYSGQYLDGVGIGYLTMNRNKRSVSIDLKTDESHEIAERIVEETDVLMQNFRPGVKVVRVSDRINPTDALEDRLAWTVNTCR